MANQKLGIFSFAQNIFKPRTSVITNVTAYLWGAGADLARGSGGYASGTFSLPVESGYDSLEIYVGQSGQAGSSTRTFGGGGGGYNSPTRTSGSGGGFTAIFAKSPTSSPIMNPGGTALNVPISEADSRCILLAGGAGGKDQTDGLGGGGGGGLTAPTIPGLPGTAPTVNRSGGGNAYLGLDGTPGPWSSGGGGGGFEGGFAANDWDAWGGCGFNGQNSPSGSNPFTGISPVNGFTYSSSNTFAPPPSPGTVPYDSANPLYNGVAGKPGYPGYAVIIVDGSPFTFSYTGSIQTYP